MTTVNYTISGIHCKHCTHTIETELGEMEGIQSVRASEETKQVSVSFDDPANEEKIKALLAEIGYPIAA